MALTLHGTVSDNTVALDRKTATPLIINGDMQIAQRGTSVTGITATGYYTIDRFLTGLTSLGTWTQSQSTDVPSSQGFSNSFKLDCTTADASPASTDNIAIMQRFEGQNLQMLKKGTSDAESVTVSFWVKTNKTGTYVLELRDADNVRIICKTYTVDSANTWEKKVLSFAGDTTGTLTNDENLSFHARWWLGAGSDFTSGTLQTTWGAQSNANRAVGQTVNLADSTSNDWYITGVQLEVGTFDANSIPPFQFEDRATSLNRCMRYYERNQGTGSNREYFSVGIKRDSYSGSDATVSGIMTYKVRKRATPTIGYNGATSFVYTHGVSSENNFSSINIQNIGLDHARFQGEIGSTTANSGGIIARREETDRYYDIDSEL
jgi:hypothetical protein